MPWLNIVLTLILAPLMALSFAVPGAWSQAMPQDQTPVAPLSAVAADAAPQASAGRSASVAGTWCGTGLLRGTQIRLEQAAQQFHGTLTRGERTRRFDGTIDGNELHPSSGSAAQLGLRIEGEQLRIASARGNLALLQGASFTRTSTASCMN